MAEASSLARVKICGITNLPDALAAARFGADAIGLRLRPKLGLDQARSIVRDLPPFIASVLLINTQEQCTPEVIVKLCNYVGVTNVQIYPEFDGFFVEVLRKQVAGIKVIKGLGVAGEETIATADEYQEFVDALLLDTRDARTGQLGGTGIPHDWAVSRQIVTAVGVPVVLAGGLNLANVRLAMERVRPWGVDCETGVEKSDGIKDHEKLRSFIATVKGLA